MLRCWHWCSQPGRPFLCVCVCVGVCAHVCGKLFHGHKFFPPIYMPFCNVTLLFPYSRGKVSFSIPLNLGQTCFALINRMWQQLCCVRLRVLASKDLASFFFFLIIYLYLFIYIWLCWVFVSVWGLSPVAASGGHSSSRCAGLSLSRLLLLRSTGSRHAGSVIVAHGPSRSAACGIFPDQGSNPCPLHWQADSQPLYHQGSPTLHPLPSLSIHFPETPTAFEEYGLVYGGWETRRRQTEGPQPTARTNAGHVSEAAQSTALLNAWISSGETSRGPA